MWALAGMMSGQATKPSFDFQIIPQVNNDGSLRLAQCADHLRFGASSRLIRDIFPEECGERPPGAFPMVCSVDPGGMSGTCHATKPAKPEDVPAISHISRFKPSRNDAAFVEGFVDECRKYARVDENTKECLVTKWTCADKARVLLTAENGKKWCHKVKGGE
jgi:hypothetical protein